MCAVATVVAHFACRSFQVPTREAAGKAAVAEKPASELSATTPSGGGSLLAMMGDASLLASRV